MTDKVRRQATIVTSDLKGSTALGERLDPESLREVLSTYFDEMRAVFESHGGTIEKIIGDAIVAVFGLTAPRDDDALRAVEAAAESQRALALLNDRLEARWGVRLTVRTGVATGEVVVGEASAGQHVLTGPTVGLATAMEQNAPPLEVLLAASTYEAVRDAVEVESVGELRARGSDEPLRAYRLLAVTERPDAERFAAPVDDAGTHLAIGETRKTVTIVFADPKPRMANGGAPSPEALRDVMSRYFTVMQQALARHGATVEKFIGDAVMAVFGLPVRHEDDALRAVRAASEMQRLVPELNAAFEAEWGVTVQNHIGVNTGEVVAGDASLGQRLVTGDTVNVAARLEQAAGPREILIGSLTHRLVRDAVTVEEVEPLTLKGKADKVPAYRLVGVSEQGEGFRRRTDAPMIGRELELAALGEQFDQALREHRCRMATVVGDAGVGKTRLIREFSSNTPAPAIVIRGRCLPYGQGITFWPLREAARDAAGIGTDDSQETAIAKLRALVPDEAVAERLASVIGLSEEPFPVPEVFWGARKFLEGLGHDRPVLMVIDDVHWAEQTFLELIDDLVESVEGSAVLLLCTSRHDLLEARPEWGIAPRQLRIVLSPLGDSDAARVVDGLLGDAGIDGDVQARIVTAAAGNPLFVEQMLSMLIDEGSLRQADGRWERVGDLATLKVPPNIQALVAARLDLLGMAERAVIEPASVVGQNFAQDAVTELVPGPIQPEVPEHLASMSRKQLVAPNPQSQEPAFRFHHVLIRDAAYDGLLKRQRADLHERFVNWAEEADRRMGRGPEFEEIQGYHLEEAYRYLSELGTLDEHARQLGVRASVKLASAGRRAMARGDTPAAVNLLRRATATRAAGDPEQLRLLPDLGEALVELGGFEEAQSVLDKAIAGGASTGNEALAAEAKMVLFSLKLYVGEDEHWAEEVVEAIGEALPVFVRTDHHVGLVRANRLLFALHASAMRLGQATEPAEEVIAHARAAGDIRLERRGALAYAQAALYGPTPVAKAIEECEALVAASGDDRRTQALIQSWLAQLLAMAGELERARATYEQANATLRELGGGLAALSTSVELAQIELLGGDLSVAEDALRRDYAELSKIGEKYILSGVVALLAKVLARQRRFEEVEQLSHELEGMAAPDDTDAQVNWRGLCALALARRGELPEAEELANDALQLALPTEVPVLQAEAFVRLAVVLKIAGKSAESAAALKEARRRYRAKGDVVSPRLIEEALRP
jgi:class 3 adenylate cyclase/tetratricopeptide (TPR) repeat protein